MLWSSLKLVMVELILSCTFQSLYFSLERTQLFVSQQKLKSRCDSVQNGTLVVVGKLLVVHPSLMGRGRKLHHGLVWGLLLVLSLYPSYISGRISYCGVPTFDLINWLPSQLQWATRNLQRITFRIFWRREDLVTLHQEEVEGAAATLPCSLL